MSKVPERLLAEVRELMAGVFDLPVDDLPPGSTPDNTRGWDSLSHLALIATLERHYGISISHDDAVTLLGDVEIADYVGSTNGLVSNE
jgi:acyl carrier protein